jgi:DHA2 family multidrug resistance protein
MAIWGGAVMLGPIMGPTLGGLLTEAYSWHWVFLINVPIGILTVTGLILFMEETKPQGDLRFDWFGFSSFSIGIGALQLMLDRGEQQGWFSSTEIIIELIVAVAGFYFFVAHAFTGNASFIRFSLFKDRNFFGGCMSMGIFGAAMLGTLALVSPFMQNVLGYPVDTAGYLMAMRGVGTFAAMLFLGKLLRVIEARHLMQAGFILLASSLYLMSLFTEMTSQSSIIVVSLLQGFGIGLVFVPRNLMAFSTLAPHLRADGTAMMTLFRNVGGSIGISVLIANLSSGIRVNYAELAGHLTPFNDALWMPEIKSVMNLTTEVGRALADKIVEQQASVIAYAADFRLLTFYVLCALPLTLLLDSSRGVMAARARPAGDPPA